jgi:hypothetical protein
VNNTLSQAADHYDGPSLWRQLPQEASGHGLRVSPTAQQIFGVLLTPLSSPMSFFSTVDTGITLNRFSQDLMLIDMELPITALNTFASKYPDHYAWPDSS